MSPPLPFAEMKDNYFMINGRGYPDTINPNPADMLNNASGMSGGIIGDYVAQTMDARIVSEPGPEDRPAAQQRLHHRPHHGGDHPGRAHAGGGARGRADCGGLTARTPPTRSAP